MFSEFRNYWKIRQLRLSELVKKRPLNFAASSSSAIRFLIITLICKMVYWRSQPEQLTVYSCMCRAAEDYTAPEWSSVEELERQLRALETQHERRENQPEAGAGSRAGPSRDGDSAGVNPVSTAGADKQAAAAGGGGGGGGAAAAAADEDDEADRVIDDECALPLDDGGIQCLACRKQFRSLNTYPYHFDFCVKLTGVPTVYIVYCVLEKSWSHTCLRYCQKQNFLNMFAVTRLTRALKSMKN